ncbi:MAG: branched-chain amino acid ABC transporter permease [Bacillota bacterium]|nr:branched-chain amino acid ABC transporter permease [Bacillota bacterium]MDI7249063.1 branched-chain amino acid ABC transporter permease [Bacillota bacterium]
MWADILVNALMNASVYAMLAVGFSLIFGVARIINLTHTALYMLAAYLIFSFTTGAGMSLLPAALLSIAAVVALAVISYKLLIDPMREHETTVLIITVALALAFQELMLIFYGGHFRSVPTFLAGYSTVLGVRVSNQYLLTIGALAVILGVVWLLLMKTRLGLAIRAAAQDREIANVMGMDVSLVATAAVAVGAALAGTAGALVAPLLILEPRMWLHPLTIVLAVVVLGGLGSLKGSLLAAFIIALTETLVVFLVPLGAFLKGAVSLAIMILVLLLRPEGLFGVAFEEER